MSRQSKLIGLIAVAVLLGLVLGVPVLAKGNSKPTVHCSRDGVLIASIEKGVQFTISGDGYKRYADLSVCIDDYDCTSPRADRDGRFHTGRTLYDAGVRTITVYETRRNGAALRASGTITVIDE